MKTNKGFIGVGVIIAIVAVLAVAGGGYAVWKSKGAERANDKAIENANENSAVKGEDSTNPSGKKMAFSSFIKQGGSYKCTVHQNVAGSDADGIVYLDDGRIRADYTVSYNGTTMTGSSVIKDGYAYTWTSLTPTGFKIAVKDDMKNGDISASSGSYSWSADQIGDYDCVAWKADASLFTIPSNITFQEMKS